MIVTSYIIKINFLFSKFRAIENGTRPANVGELYRCSKVPGYSRLKRGGGRDNRDFVVEPSFEFNLVPTYCIVASQKDKHDKLHGKKSTVSSF